MQPVVLGACGMDCHDARILELQSRLALLLHVDLSISAGIPSAVIAIALASLFSKDSGFLA